MGQQNNEGSCLRRLIVLARPCQHGLAVGRVAEDAVRAPVLAQPVLLLGEVARTLGVGWRGARIESEKKLLIEIGIEGARRRPFVGAAGEVNA